MQSEERNGVIAENRRLPIEGSRAVFCLFDESAGILRGLVINPGVCTRVLLSVVGLL